MMPSPDASNHNVQGAAMTWPIWIDSNGGSIGRFNWVNTDSRRTASSWTFWGDWWWGR